MPAQLLEYDGNMLIVQIKTTSRVRLLLLFADKDLLLLLEKTVHCAFKLV